VSKQALEPPILVFKIVVRAAPAKRGWQRVHCSLEFAR
jgi:hypothetical protein